MKLSLVIALGAACACGCASTPPSHHPSAAEYDRLAAQNEKAARDELTSANVPARPQHACGGASMPGGSWEPCWTPNTDAARVDAEKHWKEALVERANARALREAEARACAGVSQLDRDVSPFAHVKDIVAVEPIRDGHHLLGAAVTFRRVPTLTRDSLQRIVSCHIAQANELGHDVDVETFCPLNLPDVHASVIENPRGFVVLVTSDDEDAAREVLHRSEQLLR